MTYVFIILLLFILELVYFKVADRFNIIDKPNERSSHSVITLRGGGIVFYFSVVIYFLTSGFQYPWFFLGLTMMAGISFLDDIFTLSSRIRLLIHFSSILLMAFQLELFDMPLYVLLIGFIVGVGVINAYNFMDGINGITACYSLSVVSLLMIVNERLSFIDKNLLIYVMLGLLVFSFFNFRTKAVCFAGDVGSVAIAYILLFGIGTLILSTGKPIYILFLVVYGIDSIWTIIRRIRLKENIFKPHRSHLYQYLGNEVGLNKLLISFLYGGIQFVIGCMVIVFANRGITDQVIFSSIIIVGLSGGYLILKKHLLKRYT